MADTSAQFTEPNGVLILPPTDPVDFDAVIMPLTAVQDQRLPTVTVVSPPPGRIGRYSAVILRAADELELVRVNLWVEYANGNSETIYGAGRFMRRFRDASTVTTIVASRELEFALRPLGGWPGGAMDFQIEAVDLGHNISQ